MSLPMITWYWEGRILIGPGGTIDSQRQAKKFIELIEELSKRLPEGGEVKKMIEMRHAEIKA